MVLALAESVSIQSVSLALQTIHGQPTWTELFRKMFKELGVGVMLGLGCGVLVGMIALLWKGQMDAALSLLLGVAGGVSGAAGVGVSLPYLLKLFRRDPQVASGPIALAASDMLTLILYFNLGRWILL
jgi:magnesium transporter